MSDVLEQALWPFPAKSWAHVLDAVREHPCDAAQIRSRLAAGGVLDDTITTLQVQNVAWKLRGGFPEWFSEPPAPAPPQALVEVLHPLPLHALGHYLRAALQHPSEPDRVRACLLDGGVVDASVTALALHNVQAKVRAAFPGWLPEEPSAARNLPVACTLCSRCGSALQPHALLPCFILTYGQGQRPLQVEQRLCLACDRVFAACWSWPRGPVARARLEARPGPDLLLVLCPQRASVAAVDAALFRFLSASLVHVRSSFRGFADLLRDFHTIPAGEHLHDSLLHGWLVYYAVAFLADAHWSELLDVVFCFGRHDRSLQLETLDVLGELLQTAFLRRYSSEHSCMRCTAVPTLAFDGKVNRAVPVCHVPTGKQVHMLRGDVLLDYGCLCGRARGSFACAAHHSSTSAAATSLLCSRGHRLRRGRIALAGQATCILCCADFAVDDIVWRCNLGCVWTVCHACATPASPEPPSTAQLSAAPPSGVISCDTLGQTAGLTACSEEELLAQVANPCRLVKGIEPGLSRYYGNTLTALLACGRVAFIMPMAGKESLTQVFGMLAAVRTRRYLKYVVYDNACALARFARGLAARQRQPSEARALCRNMVYVLDRWHEANHTACRDSSHRLYMPEVRIDQYEDLRDYDSTLSETFNAWLEHFVGITRHMQPATFDCYVLLLAILWNENVVSRPGSRLLPAASPAAAAAPALLKRARPGPRPLLSYCATSLETRRTPALRCLQASCVLVMSASARLLGLSRSVCFYLAKRSRRGFCRALLVLGCVPHRARS